MQTPTVADFVPGLQSGREAIVLDTNIVLDLCVFEDARCASLRARLEARTLRWLVTPPMREELLRVLDYPQVARRLVQRGIGVDAAMAWFDGLAHMQIPAPKAPYTCKDPDDQKFIDLAVAHTAQLLSKDHAVLCMAKRLQRLGVTVASISTP